MKKTFTGPDGVTYTYTYDDANQLAGVEIPGQGTITYSSYTWNRPEEVILPGGSRRQYVYDPLMRVKSITAKDPGQNVVLSYLYSYDKMDNITEKSTEHGLYDYGYDDLYRLTTADNPAQTDEAYSYDGVGNRLTSADQTDWTYNDNNELQGFDGVTFRYDANGNTIEKNDNGKITKYFYNIEDRMVRVEDGAGAVIATYYYDPFGRRLWKEVDAIRTYFVYSDEGLVGEYYEGGHHIRSYGYKPSSTWTTDPLFLKENDQYCFYQNDHLGTPQKITGINGAVVWSGRYSSFGKVEIEAGSSVTNNLRFGGQYYDQETGLHYNYHRYYNPKLGRYLSADPIGLAGGVNLFAYAESNPIYLLDPKGLQCGPGTIGDWYVPDFIFREICVEHDRCYEGKPPYSCQTPKSKCDKDACERFKRKCIEQRNNTEKRWQSGPKPGLPPDIEYDACMASAVSYCKAVSMTKRSKKQFDKERKKTGCCPP